MASIFVLYVDDNIAGPCLQLIRNICEPSSSSKPHITVRGPIRRLSASRDIFRHTTVSHITLIEPGGFNVLDGREGQNCTVFIRCGAETLDAVAYKPDYPDSVFHITLYDGESLVFAQELLRTLGEFPWRLSVPLPPGTRLTEIQLKGSRRKRVRQAREYDPRVQRLLGVLRGKLLDPEYAAALSQADRLELVRDVCAHLHAAMAQAELAVDTAGTTGGVVSPHGQSSPPFAIRSAPSAAQGSLADGWGERPNDTLFNPIGLYLTPPELAEEIAQCAVRLLLHPSRPIHFGDPAIGTGTFFGALCRSISPGRIASAVGVEIDRARAEATRQKWASLGLQVVCGDLASVSPPTPRTLLLSNPPYVRHQHLAPKSKRALRERTLRSLGVTVSGLAGLYVYFLLLSHEWLDVGAVAAWLVPSEFMEANYGAAVRQYLTQRVQLLRIHRFDAADAQFENALVSSSVILLRNTPPSDEHGVELTYGGSLSHPAQTHIVPVKELGAAPKWSIPPRPRPVAPPRGPRIGDLFTVRRGIATGANDFFIMQRDHAAHDGIPESALRPLLPKARALASDVVEREEDGYPSIFPQLCLLDCALPERVIESTFPRLMEYLQSARELGILERALVRARTPWYRQERREAAPFLCTYMGRGSPTEPPLRFIWNKSDAVATNVYLMLYPRNELASILSDRPAGYGCLFALLQETAVSVLSSSGRIYGGGLHKIEPSELEQVCLPSLPSWLDPAAWTQLSLT